MLTEKAALRLKEPDDDMPWWGQKWLKDTVCPDHKRSILSTPKKSQWYAIGFVDENGALGSSGIGGVLVFWVAGPELVQALASLPEEGGRGDLWFSIGGWARISVGFTEEVLSPDVAGLLSAILLLLSK